MKKTTIINALDAIGLADTNQLFSLDIIQLEEFAKPKLDKITPETIEQLNRQLVELELKPYRDDYDKVCICRLHQQIKSAKQVLAMRMETLV